jgi:hypothetical protein
MIVWGKRRRSSYARWALAFSSCLPIGCIVLLLLIADILRQRSKTDISCIGPFSLAVHNDARGGRRAAATLQSL